MLALVTLLALLAPQNPAPGPQVDWAELMRRYQADAAALQKSGAQLDLGALKLEKLMPGELGREIGKRESAFFGSGWYEMLWVLGQGLGLKVDATADRRAGVLRVDAIHEDVPFTKAMSSAIRREIDDLASWLDLALADVVGQP